MHDGGKIKHFFCYSLAFVLLSGCANINFAPVKEIFGFGNEGKKQPSMVGAPRRAPMLNDMGGQTPPPPPPGATGMAPPPPSARGMQMANARPDMGVGGKFASQSVEYDPESGEAFLVPNDTTQSAGYAAAPMPSAPPPKEKHFWDGWFNFGGKATDEGPRRRPVGNDGNPTALPVVGQAQEAVPVEPVHQQEMARLSALPPSAQEWTPPENAYSGEFPNLASVPPAPQPMIRETGIDRETAALEAARDSAMAERGPLYLPSEQPQAFAAQPVAPDYAPGLAEYGAPPPPSPAPLLEDHMTATLSQGSVADMYQGYEPPVAPLAETAAPYAPVELAPTPYMPPQEVASAPVVNAVPDSIDAMPYMPEASAPVALKAPPRVGQTVRFLPESRYAARRMSERARRSAHQVN